MCVKADPRQKCLLLGNRLPELRVDKAPTKDIQGRLMYKLYISKLNECGLSGAADPEGKAPPQESNRHGEWNPLQDRNFGIRTLSRE